MERLANAGLKGGKTGCADAAFWAIFWAGRLAVVEKSGGTVAPCFMPPKTVNP